MEMFFLLENTWLYWQLYDLILEESHSQYTEIHQPYDVDDCQYSKISCDDEKGGVGGEPYKQAIYDLISPRHLRPGKTDIFVMHLHDENNGIVLIDT